MYQKIQSHIPVIAFQKGDMNYTFLETGDIYEFCRGGQMVNQFTGNMSDGAVSNLYLRIFRESGKPEVYPLRGKASGAVVRKKAEGLIFERTARDISCRVEFIPINEKLWLWNTTLDGKAESCDLVYIQDVGVADKGAISSNLLYVSQYLDHTIMENEWGYVIGSRQNMSQSGKNPYLQQGCLGKRAVGYATDAMQLYGRKSKLTHIPETLFRKTLPNEKYQYEMGCIALQTESFALDGKENICFYGYYTDDFPQKTQNVQEPQIITEAWKQAEAENCGQEEELERVPYKDYFGEKFSSRSFDKEEIDRLFPERNLEEQDGEALLSFFTEGHHHIVLQEKEIRMERPHGHILMGLMPDNTLDKEIMTATTYMYGVFCSQLVIGNVDSNPLLTNAKGLLNLHQESGLRIFIKLDGKYCLLTMPAAYEIGLNVTRWYYRIRDDVLRITTFMTTKKNAMVITARSEKKQQYEFLVTMSLALGTGGTEEEAQLKVLENGVSLKPGTDKASTAYYPDLEYFVTFSDGSAEISDDRIFYEDGRPRNALLLTGRTKGDFELVIRGVLDKKPLAQAEGYVCEKEEKKYLSYYNEFLNHVEMHSEGHEREAARLNEICYWYLHNALIHYAVPHGLEQSGGAAWGTRDVCQGPMELFLSTGHFKLARNTLLEIFAHQSRVSGEWPQWFMFDKYPYSAGDCHGDVVFWPLKCVGDYIEASGDTDILKETIPYTEGGEAEVLEHIKTAFDNIRSRYLRGTFLINYAGGDWDDTLQPAHPEMKENLCSAWTQALAWQTLGLLGKGVSPVDPELGRALAADCAGIKKDFEQYLIKDGVIAGFVLMEPDGKIIYMLHPRDEKTGLHFRLLPQTRSIIAGLASPEQAEINNRIIDEKLTFPDGVRLMDRPAEYDGGVSKNFVRAEQAANVGREISLQYVHAHIRYIEAMAKLGESEKVMQGLLKVNPICITDTVKNADLRQANTYFSSSEGDYKDRYDFRDNFEKLRTGEIKTKGGWRIYSSGPGIYLGRLIRDMLGIRIGIDEMVLDPVIAPDWDGLTLRYHFWGKEYRLIYHVREKGCGVACVKAGNCGLSGYAGKENGIYREPGIILPREWLEHLETDQIDIFLR